ncbi:Imm63 family immunity protein [Pantoea ananatis]|uniref:Imm63 family immunity protein n=1 Tax=Pantoea ananas TaxID=553 RepID=UPI00059B6148|nr:Imm63 family immunity protein [Pantoea ananatis]UEG17596.1 immunity 63 family protein [Pantoea ananatis]
MKTIEELRASHLKIGEQLGGGIRPNYYFTIPDQPDGVGMPYLEISGEAYHFVACERGIELIRKSTLDYEDVLYWFTDDGVRALASEYAASNESSHEEFRNLYFRKQFYLMLSVKTEWATRKKNEIKQILIS